ncbi:MAG: tRNA pseudouridine(55) synthase TruB [Spirochaetes bacterium]|nr:tRNA pseudouridine(55) synthase TruB [Spirochaetota bacterium]
MFDDYLIMPIIKPSGFSSAQYLNIIKKNFLSYIKFEILSYANNNNKIKNNLIKFGHTGTLDPFACGVLLILCGKACKLNFLFNYLPKEYITVIKLGEKRNTGDITGIKIGDSEIIDRYEIEKNLNIFRGKIEQYPHKFSAVKINGQRAYKLARENREFELKKREIFIYENKLLNYNKKLKKAVIYVKCSSGTYIRKYIEDIVEYSGKFAYCEKLVRKSIGPFNLRLIVQPINFERNFIKNKISYPILKPYKYLFEDYFQILSQENLEKEVYDFLSENFKRGKTLNRENIKEIIEKSRSKEYKVKDKSLNSELYLFFNTNDLLTTVFSLNNNKVEYLFNYPQEIN